MADDPLWCITDTLKSRRKSYTQFKVISFSCTSGVSRIDCSQPAYLISPHHKVQNNFVQLLLNPKPKPQKVFVVLCFAKMHSIGDKMWAKETIKSVRFLCEILTLKKKRGVQSRTKLLENYQFKRYHITCFFFNYLQWYLLIEKSAY